MIDTFKKYVAEADALAAKWIIDKKRRGHIILKAGTKMLFKMCKYPNMDTPYAVHFVYATKRKMPGHSFETLKQAMAHIDKMFTYGITERYAVEPMKKEVVDWLEKCTY